ncbi:MAG: hypothetical protein ACYDAQ_21610 [Mycobacteriales bacterium]
MMVGLGQRAPIEPEVAAVIARWRPRRLSEPAADFVRRTVSSAGPQTADRAKALLFAAGHLAAFATSAGLELRPEVVLHPSVIERFVVSGTAQVSAPTRRTLRTNLRFLARAVLPSLGPAPVPLPREHAKAPYTDAQLAGYLALADAQPTPARRMRAAGLICAGAGAGLVGADLREVRGLDIAARFGGVVVQVRGRHERTVPVLAGYHERVLAAAAFAGDGYLVGGTERDRPNVTNRLVASFAGGAGLPRLQVARLRASWLIAVAEQIGLATFMAAAGFRCSQRLGDIVAALPVGTEADAVALLGGTR